METTDQVRAEDLVSLPMSLFDETGDGGRVFAHLPDFRARLLVLGLLSGEDFVEGAMRPFYGRTADSFLAGEDTADDEGIMETAGVGVDLCERLLCRAMAGCDCGEAQAAFGRCDRHDPVMAVVRGRQPHEGPLNLCAKIGSLHKLLFG